MANDNPERKELDRVLNALALELPREVHADASQRIRDLFDAALAAARRQPPAAIPSVQARAEALAKDIDFAIDVTESRETLLSRFAAILTPALDAERQQQQAETLREVQHLVSRLRLDDSVTDTFVGGIATALMAITGALDATVLGVREDSHG